MNKKTVIVTGWMVWEAKRNGTTHGVYSTLKLFRTEAEANAFVASHAGSGRYFDVTRFYNKNRWTY